MVWRGFIGIYLECGRIFRKYYCLWNWNIISFNNIHLIMGKWILTLPYLIIKYLIKLVIIGIIGFVIGCFIGRGLSN